MLFLPARDEAPRVRAVIERAPRSIDGREVIVAVIDDGSSDDTAAVALSAGALVVQHPVNLGLGAAVRTGFELAKSLDAAAVAFCDADGEYDPNELVRVVAPILSGGANYVVGSRFAGEIGHIRPHRWLGNKVLTRALRLALGAPISDGQSGFRALSHDAVQATELAHDYNYAQVLTIDLVKRGFGYTEVPISYSFRRSGRSFVSLPTYLKKVIPAVARQLFEHRELVHEHRIDAGLLPGVLGPPRCSSPSREATALRPAVRSI